MNESIINDPIPKFDQVIIKNITNDFVTNGSIINGSITNGSITNGSITNGSITNGSITNGSVTNDSIINEDLTQSIWIKEDEYDDLKLVNPFIELNTCYPYPNFYQVPTDYSNNINTVNTVNEDLTKSIYIEKQYMDKDYILPSINLPSINLPSINEPISNSFDNIVYLPSINSSSINQPSLINQPSININEPISNSFDNILYLPSININHFHMLNYYKNIYTISDHVIYENTTNFANNNFCFYCQKYKIIPDQEINNFLYNHIILNKNPKYLKIVYRLCPEYFSTINVLSNKYLKNIVQNKFGIHEKEIVTNPTLIFNNYLYDGIFEFDIVHRFDILFHQENLTYCDYIKCDICKYYMCPMHVYLSNCYFAKCNICKEKLWNLCGWCKFHFNEQYACYYIH